VFSIIILILIIIILYIYIFDLNLDSDVVWENNIEYWRVVILFFALHMRRIKAYKNPMPFNDLPTIVPTNRTPDKFKKWNCW